MGGLKEVIKETHSISDVKRVEYFDSRYYRIQYEKKGKKIEQYFPSVTEILGVYPKDFLARWRGDVGNDRADQIVYEAFQLGSFIHYGAEIIAKGGAVIYNPISNPQYSQGELEDLFEKYQNNVCICRTQREFLQLYRIWQFFELLKPENVETEQTVYSVEHMYAGTLDLILKVKGGKYNIGGSAPVVLEDGYYICDFKTGKSTDYSNLMQLSAYFNAVVEGAPKIESELRGGMLLHPNSTVKTGIEGFKATLLKREDAEATFKNFLKVFEVYKVHKPVPTPKMFSMPSLLTRTLETKRKVKK